MVARTQVIEGVKSRNKGDIMDWLKCLLVHDWKVIEKHWVEVEYFTGSKIEYILFILQCKRCGRLREQKIT